MSRKGVSNCFAISLWFRFAIQLETRLKTCLKWLLRSLQLEETENYYNAGQACNVVIKVFTCIQTAWNRVRSMFSTVLTAITTIWRPGLMNLTQCMLCVRIYCVYRIIICYILNCEQDWVGLCFGELCVCWVLLRVWLPQTINLHRLLKFSA